MSNIKKLRPFKHICMTIGNLPSSYIDSMSYYECLLWLIKFLQNEVIPTVNNNSEVVEELQNYVENYFSNLDVQDEINNKLDIMVESGQLQEIISEYLNSKAIFGYTNVAEMKQAQNLIDGSYAKTYGYYSINDGGSAFYKIRSVSSSDDIDNMFIIGLNNNLVAELLIIDNTINIKQLGAYGDNIHNDYDVFVKAFKYISTKNKSLEGFSNKYITYNLDIPKSVYLIEESNILSQLVNERATYLNVNGNNSILHFTSDGNGFTLNDTLLNVIFKDIVFVSDSNDFILFNNISNGGTQGLKFIDCAFKGTYEYVYHLTGSNVNSEMVFNYCEMTGSWLAFLYTETSDQFLNYWFTNCKYWCSSKFIKAPKGGHFKLQNCDISGYQPENETYLYELGAGSGAYGVQTFIDNGSRYELKSTNSKVITSNWDQGQIVFSNCDFSSSVSLHNASSNVYKFIHNSNTPSIIKFDNCKLLGKFYLDGNGTVPVKVENCVIYGLDTTNINTIVEFPNKTVPFNPYLLIRESYLTDGTLINSSYKFSRTGGTLQSNTTSIKLNDSNNNITNNTTFKIVTPTIITRSIIVTDYAPSGYDSSLIVKSKIGTVSGVASANSFNLNTDLSKNIKPGVKLQINGNIYEVSTFVLANYVVGLTANHNINIGDDVYLVLNSNLNVHPNRNNNNVSNLDTYTINKDIVCEVTGTASTPLYYGYVMFDILL